MALYAEYRAIAASMQAAGANDAYGSNAEFGGVTLRIRQRQAWWFPAVLAGAISAWTLAAQAPVTQPARVSTAQGSASIPAAVQYPTPTNLQALPKTMTGRQVHELMEEWSRDLGTQCDACHTVDRTRMGADGHPALNYADDQKDLKQVSRMMYAMMDQMNVSYVAKVHGSGVAVSCGMCHRGELGAQPYAPVKKVDLPESVIRQVECAEQEMQQSAK